MSILNSLIFILIRLIVAIILTVVVNKFEIFNGNKKIIICGVWIYFILSFILHIVSSILVVLAAYNAYFILIKLLLIVCKYIGLILVIVGIIKSLVKIERRKENKKDNITNILD